MCILVLLVLTLFSLPALASDEKFKELTPETLNNATIPNTHVFVMNSKSNDASHRIYVSFPLSYFNNESNRYPVLYVLDGNYGFATVVQMLGTLNMRKELPEMMVVGLGYPTDTIPEWAAQRRRDYSPTPFPNRPESGKADKFLEFIQKELIPLIERNFRVTSDRTLMGYSLGGVFGWYALFKAPETFTRYLVGSPRPYMISSYEVESLFSWQPEAIYDFLLRGGIWCW
jgi:predicted alpha/beta superfamily hydrolase